MLGRFGGANPGVITTDSYSLTVISLKNVELGGSTAAMLGIIGIDTADVVSYYVEIVI